MCNMSRHLTLTSISYLVPNLCYIAYFIYFILCAHAYLLGHAQSAVAHQSLAWSSVIVLWQVVYMDLWEQFVIWLWLLNLPIAGQGGNTVKLIVKVVSLYTTSALISLRSSVGGSVSPCVSHDVSSLLAVCEVSPEKLFKGQERKGGGEREGNWCVHMFITTWKAWLALLSRSWCAESANKCAHMLARTTHTQRQLGIYRFKSNLST